MPKKSVWSFPWTLQAFQVGPGRTATIPALLDLLQAAAQQHAEHLGLGYYDMQAKGAVWVLNQLEVSISRLPRWREEISIQTWIEDFAGVRTTRSFRIVSQAGDTLMKAITRWVALDLDARRPMRLESLAVHAPIPDTLLKSLDFPRRLPAVETENLLYQGAVLVQDLDMLEHMNNVAFVRHLLEGYGPQFKWKIAGLAIHFLGEAHWNDPLQVFQVEAAENAFVHHLSLRTKDSEISRAFIKWLP